MPPLVELTVTELFFIPAVVPVTFSPIAQEDEVASVDPERLTEPDPATAVTVPLQVLVKLLGVATTNPAGRVSVNPTPVSDTVFPVGLEMLKVSEVLPPTKMLAAPNALVMAGGAIAFTVTEAVEVFPVPPLVELTVTELFFIPAVVPVTFSPIAQEDEVASVDPERLTEPDPATAVTVPLQVLVKLLGVATTNPAGSVSVNPTPVSDTVFPAGLEMLKVSDVLSPTKMLAAPNALVMAGGAIAFTVTEAVEVFPVPPLVELTVTLLFFVPVVVPVTLR